MAGAADSLAEDLGVTVAVHDVTKQEAVTDRLKDELGDERFEELTERGAAMTQEEAVSFARAE